MRSRKGAKGTAGVLARLSGGSVARRDPREVLLEQERHRVSRKFGGGILSYEHWGYLEGGRLVTTRYNLAYVNQALCPADNGRVLGYDNAHGFHHRHYLGEVHPVEFESFETTLERFQREWQEIVSQWVTR